ncbi:murein L,D-transpeptidase [Phenylobacterium hankyongense]|uniref:Murein L,D-transpeptidase n=2 Tax=Phenylobacterium hankyongense TaxID=1813876 RepID=A0A328B4N7_9CAUL|nr:murein L,D-transpeptidase [Phenylobacterium hankyongense]
MTAPDLRPFGYSRRTLLAALPLALAAGAAYAQEPPPAAPVPPLSPQQLADAVRTLNAAETHGLPHQAFTADDAPETIALALARYAKAVHVGRLAPADFLKEWGVRPAAYDPAADLGAAVATDRLGPWLESLPPPYSGYRALRRGLAAYREIAAAGGWQAIPAGPAFGLGAKGARVAALRTRLAVEDKSAPKADGAFDSDLQDAVARAQRRFGLKPDGVVDPTTLEALNQPVGQRILQIIANLERWRWLPPTMPPTRVQVNSGAAIVTLFRDDKPVLSMKAVAGRPGDETPMLFSQIHSVVLNPPWNVPSSIATKELWPKEKKNPGYLARNGFVVISTGDGASRLQQKAGDQSALGRYKFDFDNPYGVYLHDTPSQGGFSRYARQASHGCVRLEKPAALAAALLDADPQWNADLIAAAVDKGDTVRARLPAPVPVFIFYWTAFAGADGQMNFRSDPYNWDRLLLQRIGTLAPAAEV